MTLTRDLSREGPGAGKPLFRALANKENTWMAPNKAWLYTIMRNIFINNYRRTAKQNTIFDPYTQ